jgi:hypothetical protein
MDFIYWSGDKIIKIKTRQKKNYWPLALIIVFTLFISTVLIVVVFSYYHTVDLVSTDYYEQGIAYQQQIERIKHSRQSVNQLRLEYDPAERALIIHFPDSLSTAALEGTVTLFRPADARQDKIIPLLIGGDHRQRIQLQDLAGGLWRIKIFWKKDRTEFYQEETVIIN